MSKIRVLINVSDKRLILPGTIINTHTLFYSDLRLKHIKRSLITSLVMTDYHLNEIQTLNTSTPQDWYILITVFTIYNYPWAYNLQKKSIHLFIWFILYIHTLSIHFITKQNLPFDAHTNIHILVAIMSTFRTKARISWTHGTLSSSSIMITTPSIPHWDNQTNHQKYIIYTKMEWNTKQ